MFNIIEKFLSVDGEGPTSGQLATFIRFQGCNLHCSWCDTTYSFSESNIKERVSAKELLQYILSNGAKNVTLTGGEPLLQENLQELLVLLGKEDLCVHIETNGSLPISYLKKKYPFLCFIVDFKLPSSNMTDKMYLENLQYVDKKDVYKFVISNKEDLEYAYDILTTYQLYNRTNVFFSPVLNKIEPVEIVNFMKEKQLDQVTLQLQLHKIIWSPDTKGV